MKFPVHIMLSFLISPMFLGCQITSNHTNSPIFHQPPPISLGNAELCGYASNLGFWVRGNEYEKFVVEAKKRGLSCGVNENELKETILASASEFQICSNATFEMPSANTEPALQTASISPLNLQP